MQIKTHFYRLLRAVSVPLCGTLRYATTMAVVCGAWWYDARYLNQAFDGNLALIKSIGGFIDGSGRAEAAMRAFSAEKMLLFAEASAIVWLSGKIGLYLLGSLFRRRRAADDTKAGTASP